MIRFTTGNLLEDPSEALVNTVNAVGVMGKGIALMFKEAFPNNYQEYARACKDNRVYAGSIFITRRHDLLGPKWIVNFATKDHWRSPSRIDWIRTGLVALKDAILELGIASVAIPPLGAGNGGLIWSDVKDEIVTQLCELQDIAITVYEPTKEYQNVAKRGGVDSLTPARALVAESIRRYWTMGLDCSLIEAQKLSWFLERSLASLGLDNPLDLGFRPLRYGPYADKLRHVLNSMDGSYLHCDRRISDAGPFDTISFVDEKREALLAYLTSEEAGNLRPALEKTAQVVDGFESPLGLELLATVDWLLSRAGAEPSVEGIRESLKSWGGGKFAADRKLRIFEPRLINLALERLAKQSLVSG